MAVNPKSVANLKRGAGIGRPAGVPNKKNRDVAEAYEKILTDPEYRAALRRRLIRGSAQAMEVTMHHYVYGKPKETIDMNVSDYRKMPTDELVERARELAARLDGTTHAKRILEDA